MKGSNPTSKNEFFLKLKWAFNENNFDSIEDLDIQPNVASTLIYNTNDLCLNKNQLDALINIIDAKETIYVAQNDSEEIYKFDLPMSYDEYQSLNLFSITFLSSSKFNWVVIIDEGLESGIGIIVAADDEFIDKFHFQYKEELNDIYDLISFHYRDALRNPHSVQNLTKILSCLHRKSHKKQST